MRDGRRKTPLHQRRHLLEGKLLRVIQEAKSKLHGTSHKGGWQSNPMLEADVQVFDQHTGRHQADVLWWFPDQFELCVVAFVPEPTRVGRRHRCTATQLVGP